MSNVLPKHLRNAVYTHRTRLEELEALMRKASQLMREVNVATGHGLHEKAQHKASKLEAVQARILLISEGLDMTKDQHRHISRTRAPKLKAKGSWTYGAAKAQTISIE